VSDLIKKNYSSNKVVKIEKEIRDYEIKLDNGLEPQRKGCILEKIGNFGR